MVRSRICQVVILVVFGVALTGCSPEENLKRSDTTVEITRLKQGWQPMGVEINQGDHITFGMRGEIPIAGIKIPFEPKHGVWGRIGDRGDIFQFTFNHETIISDAVGQLYVMVIPSGLLFANRQGDLLPIIEQVPDGEIDISVRAIVWNGDAEAGLAQMIAGTVPADAELARNTMASMKQLRTLPDGFEYMWNLATSNVFESFHEGDRQGVHANTNDDAGIIIKAVDLPLTEDTRIEFDWLYNQLPALASETDAATHDYMSIAVEFDNGRDITWMWSKDLAEDTHFECPLPEWIGREWHYVLQTGNDDLGNWYHHDRPILEDYRKTIPGEVPTRIVAVWFIANSIFGRQQADAYFSDVVLKDGDISLHIFE